MKYCGRNRGRRKYCEGRIVNGKVVEGRVAE